MKAYKIPKGIVNELREIKGSQGSTLNPIEDVNGNFIISVEEFKSKEFDLSKYEFELIEYEPVIIKMRK